MDYSTSISEAEDPAEASPWGNSPGSSPRANRTGLGNVSGEPPSSPFPSVASNGAGQAGEIQGRGRPSTGEAQSAAATSTEGSITAPPAPESRFSTALAEESQPQMLSHPPQLGQASLAQHHPAREQHPSKPSQPQYRLQAKVTGLERTGKKDPILRFDIHTNLPRFRTTQYRDVRRLHSEFGKLADHLISANPEALVPAVPPSLTSAGAGTDEDEARVKMLMQRWLTVVCSNEVLIRDDEMVLFVESDFGYSPVVRMKQPATGVRRKFLKQFAPPPDDTPELAEARPTVKLFYLGTMDAGHKVDKLVKARRGLGLSESEFGVKLGSMNVQEPHVGLANAFRKLGKVVQAVGDYHAAQATAEATTIGDAFQYHSSDAFIVKETLTNRQILLREFLQAQEATRGKLHAANRLKASSSVRRDKVDEAIAALEEAQQNETNLLEKTTRVSNNLVQERRKWFSRTASDLRQSFREFVLREIEAERRSLALLESVRPDIRTIDASGGLSRLGREAHPTVRRSSLAASQGPKGDAWSGVPRRSDATSRSVPGSFVAKVSEEGSDAQEGQETSPRLGSSSGRSGGLGGLKDDDEDRVDARNAASRLATTTF